MLTWFFDLDNTLHDASHAIFPAINVNMNRYIGQILARDGLPATVEAVNAVRVDYWKRYGATLLGMVKHHQVHADEFLREAHRFENLAAMLRAERGLVRLLRRLPGRKILLTNAPSHYARQVVRALGLQRDFSHHIAIESMVVHRQLRPKPSRAMLQKLLARGKLRAQDCVLVEDTLTNLKAAHSLGLRTALVTQYGSMENTTAAVNFVKRPHFVDVKVKSVKQLSAQLHRLR